MLRIENIKNENGIIYCDTYPEDSKEPGHLVYELASDTILENTQPTGYEYCIFHAAHALSYFRKVTDWRAVPAVKRFMWY